MCHQGIDEPLFCFKKIGKNGFKKSSTAVLYIHTSLCDFNASTDFFVFGWDFFFKSMQQTINFYIIFAYKPDFSLFISQTLWDVPPICWIAPLKRLSYLGQHFDLAAKVSELKAAAAAGLHRVRCSSSFRLALDSVVDPPLCSGCCTLGTWCALN